MKLLHTITLILLAASTLSHAEIWDNHTIPSNGIGHNSIKSEIDDLTTNIMRNNNIPGLTLAITVDDKLVYTSGHGFANWNNKTPMQSYHRAAIGSTSKILVTSSLLHLLEGQSQHDIDSYVYGSDGILPELKFKKAYKQGLKNTYPIIAMAVTQRNRVVSWYANHTYTVGKFDDLDAYHGPRSFSIQPGRSIRDIVDIAFGGKSKKFYTYYKDNTYSIGTAKDLDSVSYNRKLQEVKFAQSTQHIRGIVSNPTKNEFYAYYEDGTFSGGSKPHNLTKFWKNAPFNAPSRKARYKIRAMGLSKSNELFTWYNDDKYSKGNIFTLLVGDSRESYQRPDVKGYVADWMEEYESIQIKHLLSHTAGFARSGKPAKARAQFPNAVAHIEDDKAIPYEYTHRNMLTNTPLIFRTGSDYSYSNHGMGLSGYLIERLSGDDWYDYMRRHLLLPAKLSNIVPIGRYHNSGIDSRHHKFIDGEIKVQDIPYRTTSSSAAGSLQSSAQDLALFLVKTSIGSTYPPLLSNDTIRTMRTRPFKYTAPTQALGWKKTCTAIGTNQCSAYRLTHNGKSGYGTSYMTKYRGQVVNVGSQSGTVNHVNVVVVANSGDVKIDKLRKIMNLAALAVSDKDFPTDYDLFIPNNT